MMYWGRSEMSWFRGTPFVRVSFTASTFSQPGRRVELQPECI